MKIRFSIRIVVVQLHRPCFLAWLPINLICEHFHVVALRLARREGASRGPAHPKHSVSYPACWCFCRLGKANLSGTLHPGHRLAQLCAVRPSRWGCYRERRLRWLQRHYCRMHYHYYLGHPECAWEFVARTALTGRNRKRGQWLRLGPMARC